LRVQATNWASSFEVTTDGVGVVGHAGAVLLGELADRLGLTRALGWRGPQGRRRHPDAAVLRDLAVMLADGGDCLSDLAALRDQPELFGPVASTPTAWRVIERAAQAPDGWPGCAPPGRTLAPERGRQAPTPSQSCSSSTLTRPWCWRTATTRKVPRAPTRARSGSPRCWPTWTAGLRRASRCPLCQRPAAGQRPCRRHR
jgi:Transposase DDE domain group 1